MSVGLLQTVHPIALASGVVAELNTKQANVRIGRGIAT